MTSGGPLHDVIERLASVELAGRVLCHAAIELAGDAPRWIGRTPWRYTRVSDIAGGRFEGERLHGDILASGADWADQGYYADGAAVSRLDVRSVWRTDDGALINVTYQGRAVIPPEVLTDYQDLSRVDRIAASDYYFRITPLFETADLRYEWLNGLVSVGLGQRTRTGVLYKIYEIL